MIDAFFLNWEGGDTTGCALKTFMQANKQNLQHSWKLVVIFSHGLKRTERQSEGGAVYFGYVVVQVKACNVFQ